jgi:DNA-binding protein HU-beta
MFTSGDLVASPLREGLKKPAETFPRNTTIIIPAHNIPAFKPAKTFVNQVKNSVK